MFQKIKRDIGKSSPDDLQFFIVVIHCVKAEE